MKRLATTLLLAGACVFGCAQADDGKQLIIGYKAEINSADPHILYGPNRNIDTLVYEPLIGTDNYQKPRPGLAREWTLLSPTVWQFKLRPGVQFSDGSPLTADDVAFSILRARDLKGTRTFRTYLADIKDVTVIDPLTLNVTTREPSSVLLENLSGFGIVSRRLASDAKEEDFNGGKAAIGTGPYTWGTWSHGESLTLLRNEHYWGGEEPWSTVLFRFIKNDTSRVAALMSGDVDVIDAVPPSIMKNLRAQNRYRVESMPSYMLNYFGLDQHHDSALHVFDLDGKPLASNPLRDIRVREALSLAINRPLIDERLMSGNATPANQMVAPGMQGYDGQLPALPYDPVKARALLSAAGFPHGFRMNIQCTNDRYTNDGKVCEAVGQQLSAVGILTSVQAMPGTTFFQRATNGGPNKEPEFSMFMLG